MLDNYSVDSSCEEYDDFMPDEWSGASDEYVMPDDIVTAQVATNNPEGDLLSYQYVWAVGGEVVQTHTTADVTDTLNLTQIGAGYSGAEVTVAVTLLDGGQALSQVSATITDRASPAGPIWAAPSTPFVGPLNRPAAPAFVCPAGATSYVFTAGYGSTEGTFIGQVATSSTNGNPRVYAVVSCTTDAGATATPTSVFNIDGRGWIRVTLGGNGGLTAPFYNLTIAAADSANPGLLAN